MATTFSYSTSVVQRSRIVLFNSFGFLFIYLPLVLAGYGALARWQPGWANGWLAVASLFFYGYWDWRFLPLLLASIGFNFYCAGKLLQGSRHWLMIGVIVNLALLGYFKYAGFFLQSLAALTGTGWPGWTQILPIGISFFTFTQIAYLLDTAHGKAGRYSLIDYSLFVSYFPHLIAGPVLHHGEMMPQFARRPGLLASDAAPGLSIFVIGLAKKVLLADPLVPLVSPIFLPDANPPLVEAWVGVLAYSFQLYFDFSGYSDMAVGLSLLFGVRLPWNFQSPYKAADIATFWRCWHMTLSRFLRDYLYLPLGGNRHGTLARYRNLLITMLLGGLWHGAAWTFVLWGALHGLYLVIYHLWHASGLPALRTGYARALTFLSVCLAWVMFRAPDLAGAAAVLRGLAGLNGVSLPTAMAPLAGYLPASWQFHGLRWIAWDGAALPTLLLAAVIAFRAPNTQQIFQQALQRPATQALAPWLNWQARPVWSTLSALLFLGSLLSMNRVTEFLYFQF